MDLFSQILNQSKLGTSGQFSGGTFGSINTQDFQSKAPAIQKSVQAEQNLINKGFSEKEVKFLKLQKEKGRSMDEAIAFVEQKRQEAKGFASDANRQGFLQNAAGVGADIIGGAISEVPNFLGNTASWMSQMGNKLPTNTIPTAIRAGFSDKTYGELRAEQDAQSQKLAEYGQKGKQAIQSTGLYDPTTTSAKAGELVTDIAGSIVGPNKVGILKKGTQVLGAGKKLTTTAKIGDIALEGGLAGAKFDVGTKGDITKESVALGAIGNVGIAGALKGVGKAYEGVSKKLPASLTLGGLINPGKLDVVKKTLQVDEGVATPEDVGKWILDRVKPGNKQEIAEQLIQHAEKTKGAVDESLASIPTYFKNTEAKKALMQIRNELEGKVGLEGRLAQIDEMLAKPDYTLSELNAVKRELDNMYNLYTKTADPTAGIKAEGIRNVRSNIRKFIEDEAEKYGVNIRKLNNETATARGLADGILRKDSSESVRELLTAFAPSGAGAAIGAGQAIARGEDPLTVLRDALIGGVATRVATSTAIRTRIASALNRLAPKEVTALENYIRSGGKDAIGKKVAEKVIKEGRALPARTLTKEADFAKQGEKAIITPQTQERAIIQESKKGLSSNVKRPNGNTNNTSSNSSDIPVRPKKIQKPSPQVKPVEKTVKPSENKVETNITRNEAIEKGFSDSAKARWNKGDFTMKERGEATKYLKSNYKGKEYTIDGKKYKVDAIDNRNEQVRLVDSEGNIIRVKTNKLPETKVTDKDIFDYYNGRVQKGYKTILSQQKIVKPLTPKKESATMGDMETKKLIEEYATDLEKRNMSELSESGKNTLIKRLKERASFDEEGMVKSMKADIEKQASFKNDSDLMKWDKYKEGIRKFMKYYHPVAKENTTMTFSWKGKPAELVSISDSTKQGGSYWTTLKVYDNKLAGGRGAIVKVKGADISELKPVGIIKSKLVNGKTVDYYYDPISGKENPITYFKNN